MKKNYLFLAAATTLFAACVQTDVVTDIPEPQQQAISFETFVNKATRGAENSTETSNLALNDHHETFKVWASKTLANEEQVEVYNNNTVTYYTTTETWIADPLKYWDKAASAYYFYAAAPANINWTCSSYYNEIFKFNEGFLGLSNYTLKGTSNDNLASKTSTNDSWKDLTNATDKDLMIAEWTNAYYLEGLKPGDDGNFDYTVHFNFYHILSRLNINVKATTDAIITTTGEGENLVRTTTYSPDIKLTALDVVRLKNKGSFTEMKITTTTNEETNEEITTVTDFENLSAGTHQRWGTATLDGTYTLSAHLGTGTNELQLTSTAQATHQYLIIPQLVSNEDAYANKGTAPTTDAYIKINYTVNGEPFEAYYSLAKAFGIAKDATLAFNEGWQNTLNITISPNVIEFSAAATKWADKNNNTTDQNTSGDNAAID